MTAVTWAPTRRRTGSATGAGTMARHILRRDRVRLSVWLYSIVIFLVYFIFAMTHVYDATSLQSRATIMRTPTGVVMGGPGYGLDHYTGPVAVANEGTVYLVLAFALLSIFHVVRHTRADEESGVAELVRASAVGRRSAAVATVTTLVGHLVVTAVVSAAAMSLVSSDAPFLDALALTAGAAASGLVFGAAALIACQVSAHARTATGIALAMFGAAFVVQAAGNVQRLGGSALSWISPIAWAQQTRPFVDVRWWPILVALAATAIGLWVASALSTRRDFAAGLVHERPGPSSASPTLHSPFALAWLQQRGALFWTALGLGLMWFGTGTLMSTIDDMMADVVQENPALGQLFSDDPSEFTSSFIAVMAMFAALCVAAYGIAMMRRPRNEESSGLLEATLAAPVSRVRWLGAQLAVTTIGAVVLVLVSMLTMALGAVAVGVTDPGLSAYLTVFVTYVPPVLVFVGATTALYGWAPRALAAAWALLAFALVVGMFGPMLNLPTWVQALSPLHWVPADVGVVSWPDLIGLSAAALALTAVGVVGFGRRDVPS